MGFDTIHETVIKDISDFIKDGINISRDAIGASKGVAYSSSLTKATKGLVMEFPVLISKANHIESAGIVAKAYEAKFVTLLQMAFVASNITNSKEGLDYIKNFHTNLNSEKLSVDDFIELMDGFVESSNTITADSYAKYKAVTEDMKNLTYYFGEDINETALSSYKVMDNYGKLKVVKEMNSPEGPRKSEDILKNAKQAQALKNNINNANFDSKMEKDKFNYQRQQDYLQNTQRSKEFEYEKERNAKKDARDTAKQSIDTINTSQNILNNYIVSSDLKKANELVPTMMIVNFVYKENDNSEAIFQQLVVGVKAKLYEVEPMDVINKIITKHVDSNILLKLVQVNTRQISFVKDFLLAVNDAKLDALSKSKRGSTNKLFKVLERRAIGGRTSKALMMKDYCKAISSLVISQEEAEELLKNNIDVSNPKIIRPIMEQLNLISFAIIDESAEAVKFIWDTGDDIYESIPLSKLEREQKDGMSKKVINLMAKMNR